MEDHIPFKVFLRWNERMKPEIRRFTLEKGAAGNFHNLTAKLVDTYPGLQGKTYSVFWKDEEGDDVIISSLDELLIALNATQDLVKLFVCCKKEEPKEAYGNGTNKNSGIICDGCGTQVVGFMYKCTICKKFDLCSKCEASGVHPEHCMIRIPPSYKPKIMRMNMPPKFLTFAAAAAMTEEQRKKQSRERSYGQHAYHMPMFHKQRPKRHGPPNHGPKNHVSANHGRGFGNVHRTDTQTARSASNKKQQFSLYPYTVDVDTIKHILNNLRKFNSQQASTSNDANPTEDVPIDQGGRQMTDADKVSVKFEASTTVESKKDDSPDEVEGWSVLKKEKGAEASTEKSALAEAMTAALASVPDKPAQAKPKPRQPHPKPHIETALQKMFSMGFTNDGGWLTQLLEIKDGNVAAVLDLLAPAFTKK